MISNTPPHLECSLKKITVVYVESTHLTPEKETKKYQISSSPIQVMDMKNNLQRKIEENLRDKNRQSGPAQSWHQHQTLSTDSLGLCKFLKSNHVMQVM